MTKNPQAVLDVLEFYTENMVSNGMGLSHVEGSDEVSGIVVEGGGGDKHDRVIGDEGLDRSESRTEILASARLGMDYLEKSATTSTTSPTTRMTTTTATTRKTNNKANDGVVTRSRTEYRSRDVDGQRQKSHDRLQRRGHELGDQRYNYQQQQQQQQEQQHYHQHQKQLQHQHHKQQQQQQTTKVVVGGMVGSPAPGSPPRQQVKNPLKLSKILHCLNLLFSPY